MNCGTDAAIGRSSSNTVRLSIAHGRPRAIASFEALFFGASKLPIALGHARRSIFPNRLALPFADRLLEDGFQLASGIFNNLALLLAYECLLLA
jgi:hypothetical protein